MADIEHANPFAKSRRTNLVRTIILWSAAVIVLIGGIYFFTRSQQSNILIIGSMDDASITLNGKPVQVKDDPRGTLIPVFAGRYRLTIVRQDQRQFSQDVTVPAGKTLVVHPVFTLFPPEGSGTAAATVDYVKSSPDQRSIYYLGDNRTRLYRMEIANRSLIPLTDEPLAGVSAVEWSNDREVAIVVQTGGVFLQEIPRFDFTKQRLVKVAGPDMLSPVWDPSGNGRIAAAYFNAKGEKSLVLTGKQFSNLDRKADLSSFTNPKLVWSPDSRYIAVINRPSSGAGNNLWIYTLATGELNAVSSENTILDASFSPGGNAVLIETLEGNSRTVSAKNVTSGTDLPVSFAGTVRQTAWKDGSSFYSTGTGADSLSIRTLSGLEQKVSYTAPKGGTVTGMFYFDTSRTLVFYTENTVYTVELGKE